MELKPINLHECVTEAALETKKRNEPMVPRTFKIPLDVWSQAQKVLETNGTNPSEFIRKCFENLVAEYR